MSQKTVLISGGSRGLGADLVQFYLDQGYRVATFSRTHSDFITALENNERYKNRFLWCSATLSDIASLKECVNMTVKKFGSINILVNNAAIMKEGILMSMKDLDIAEIVNNNMLGTLQLTKQCLKSMCIAKSGNIVFISSIVALRGVNGLSVYSATKSAIPGLVRALTREYTSQGIRINAIAPGFLDTEMTQNMPQKSRDRIIRRTPLGRLGVTEDIVKVVAFLTSPDSDFISGQTITVDGGYSA
jgi:3-oxoacyl-[acyl-carrier protein] reductase